MNVSSDIPPMRAVRADEAIDKTRIRQSPKRSFFSVAIGVFVWAASYVGAHVFHVPFIAVALVASGALIVIAIVHWTRRQRA